MAINKFKMQVTIPYFSGTAEDVITNDWAMQFSTLSPSGSDWIALRGALITFYNTMYGSSGYHMAPWLRPALTSWKGYDLNDPVPRAPRHSSVSAISGTVDATSTVTPETAICLSFQGDLLSGAPQSRRRGRVFLGGLGSPFVAGSASAFPLIDGTKTGAVTGAAGTLKTSLAALGWTWSVYSRVDDASVTVTNGWIDNAADTQRRRGQKATLRATF